MPPKAAAGTKPGTRESIRRYILLFAMPVILSFLWVSLYPHLPRRQSVLCSVSRLVGSDGSSAISSRYDELLASPSAYGSAEYNRTMFWGTYRPQVMMGVKSRSPQSVLFGVAWIDTRRRMERHQTSEDPTFRWIVHDGRHFGHQKISDPWFGITLDIYFLKAAAGDGWNVRISGDNINVDHLKLVLYFATEDLSQHGAMNAISGAQLVDGVFSGRTPLDDIGPKSEALGNLITAATRDEVFVRGGTPLFDGAKGEFVAHITDETGTQTPWEVYGWTEGNKPPSQRLPHQVPLSSNAGAFDLVASPTQSTKRMHTIVLKKAMQRAIDVSVSFATRPVATAVGVADFQLLPSCAAISLGLRLSAAFHRRFDDIFGLVSRARMASKADVSRTKLVEMGEMALSNMVGGMGFWTGRYITIDPEIDAKADRTGQQIDPHVGLQHSVETDFAISLFSGVPSRAKFPRGFLWDEGFHQLLMSKWDAEISKDVIAHWLLHAKVAATGWIPREQILGEEARERVPREFVPQHPTHANPPSMVLPVQDFALEAAASKSGATDHSHDTFLLRMLPYLQQWRQWFNVTQCGGPANCSTAGRSDPFAFRWRSRHKFHLLASGLDDYARPVAKDRHTAELHLDLFCWVAMMSSTMKSIDSLMREAGHGAAMDVTVKGKIDFVEQEWEDALVAKHWDASRKRFSDVTGRKGAEKRFSEYFGYVNLFPLLTMIVNDKEKALEIVRQARAELMTGFGLASMSNASRELLARNNFPHENYWTGPIWVNLNFLFLRALKLKYIPLLGSEAADLYEQLRMDLIGNIGRVYAQTNKLFENYNPVTGNGQGTAPFTGWTSLIALIMAERY